MRRRDFIAGLVAAGTIGGAHAQQKARVYRIAVVDPSESVANMSETGSRRFGAFFQRLRDLGYIEGQNLSVERYSGEGRMKFAELAREVVPGNPDLIFVNTSRITREIKTATQTIPVVSVGADPVAYGVVSSLARPGGNITGATVDAGVEIVGKRLELLREMIPAASRVAYLGSHGMWEGADGAAMREVAQRIKISLIGPPLESPLREAEYRRVFAAMTQAGADALVVANQSELLTDRRLILKLAENARLPAIYPDRDFAEIGGLMAYGVELQDVFRHAAEQVDQILKGAKPGDIPFYQPTKFELVINAKASKAVGITVPPTLLIAADKVIE
jgi:putative ABC transport system substrate-binding protein